MSKMLIGGFGMINSMYQRRRLDNIQSQFLVNLNTKEIIQPKQEIINESFTEFLTEDQKGIIGIVTTGNYIFFGIGKSNQKCLIHSNNEKILIYSKGNYDVSVTNLKVKKIKFISKEDLSLTICYNNYPINEISNIISDYFKNVKIDEIINESENLDENWNDILSISLKNSAQNNDFSNPKIEIISNNSKKDISEITNKYNFHIILNNFNISNNNIIDDPLLISIISQDFYEFNINKENLLIWVMKYVEQFNIYTGKFFKYYQNIEKTKRHDFIRFLVSQKIASLYLKVDSEKEIDVVDTLNDIIKSNDNRFQLIKESIEIFGLVTNENSYYKYESNYYYNFNDYSLYN